MKEFSYRLTDGIEVIGLGAKGYKCRIELYSSECIEPFEVTYPFVYIQTNNLSFDNITIKVMKKIYKDCPSLEKCDLQIGKFGSTFFYNRYNMSYYLKGYYLQDALIPNISYGRGYITKLYDAMVDYVLSNNKCYLSQLLKDLKDSNDDDVSIKILNNYYSTTVIILSDIYTQVSHTFKCRNRINTCSRKVYMFSNYNRQKLINKVTCILNDCLL